MGNQGSKPQEKPAEGNAAAKPAAATSATPPTKAIIGTTAAAGTMPAKSAPEEAVPAAPIDTSLSSPIEGAKETDSGLASHALEVHQHDTEAASQMDHFHDAPEEFAGGAHDPEGKGEGEIGALAGSSPQIGTGTHPEVVDKIAPDTESARAAPRLPGSEGEIVADGAPVTAVPSIAAPEAKESDKVSGAGCFPCFAPSSGKKRKDKSAAKAGAAPAFVPGGGEPVDAAAKSAPVGAATGAVLGGAGMGAAVAAAASHEGGQPAEGDAEPLAIHDGTHRETEADTAKAAEQSGFVEHAPEAQGVASATGEPEWTRTDVPDGAIDAAAQTPVAVTDNPTFEEAAPSEQPAPSLAEKAAEPVPEALAEEAPTPVAPLPSKIPKPPLLVAEADEPQEERSVPADAPAYTEEPVKGGEPLEASAPASQAPVDTQEVGQDALRSPAQTETPILEENPVYEENEPAVEHEPAVDGMGAGTEAKPLAEGAATVDPISEDWALVEALPETPVGAAGGQEKGPLEGTAAEDPLNEEQAGLVAVPLASEAPAEEPIKEAKPAKRRGGIFACFFPQPKEAPVTTEAAPQPSPPADASPAAEAASTATGGMSTGAAVATGAAAGGATAGLFAIPFISKKKAKPAVEEGKEASPAVEARPESFTSQKSLRSQRSVESLSSKRSDSRALAAVAKPTKRGKAPPVDYSAIVLEKQKSRKLKEGYNTATGLYDAPPATLLAPGAYSPMRAMQPQLERTLSGARRTSIDRTPIKEHKSKRKAASTSGRSKPAADKGDGTPPRAPPSAEGSNQFRPMSSGPLPAPQAPKNQFRPMSSRVA